MKKPMTEKQARARKRNWLIRRLMGAKSIFSYENTTFMENILKDREHDVYLCYEAINDLVKDMRESTYKEI